eukprot:g39283.t1
MRLGTVGNVETWLSLDIGDCQSAWKSPHVVIFSQSKQHGCHHVAEDSIQASIVIFRFDLRAPYDSNGIS